MTRRTVLLCLLTALLPAHAEPAAHECLIEPAQRLEIRSPVEALIDTVNVDRGSRVRKGDVLLQLNSDIEQAALAAARYRAVMKGAIRSAETRIAYSREKLRRLEEIQRRKFASAQERDDVLAELHLAEAELLEAQDDRELAVLEGRRLAEVVAQRSLRSPVDAVVTERLQNPGELAQTGDGASAILRLAKIDALYVEVVLPVAQYGSVQVGAVATVEPEYPQQGRYEAVVAIVDPVVDSASGTFRVRLNLPNPELGITAGVKCRLRFH